MDEFVVLAEMKQGKGLRIVKTFDELIEVLKDMIIDRKFGDVGNRIIIERHAPIDFDSDDLDIKKLP